MILRIDRLQTELPPPSDPDPRGASVVQELMGGKFGEMSTLMNYTFQSFNFRGKEKYRPFYDLICNIATEEYSHIEAVAAAINLLLTGATMRADRNKPDGKTAKSTAKKVNNLAATGAIDPAPLESMLGSSYPYHFLASGQGAMPLDSMGNVGMAATLLRYRDGQSQDGPVTQLLSRMRRTRG